MPNWCSNVATLSHPEPKMIARLLASAEQEGPGVLQEFIPCPAELLDSELTTSYGDQEKQKIVDTKKAAAKAKYGYESWYDWNVANWGTKWDLCDITASQPFDDTVLLHFDTAWAPPVEAYARLEELGFTVRAYYYESGMQFAGIYEDGNDDCYQDWGDSQGARATLPQELDDTFAISESQAEWEEECEEPEELTEWIKDGVEAKEKINE